MSSSPTISDLRLWCMMIRQDTVSPNTSPTPSKSKSKSQVPYPTLPRLTLDDFHKHPPNAHLPIIHSHTVLAHVRAHRHAPQVHGAPPLLRVIHDPRTVQVHPNELPPPPPGHEVHVQFSRRTRTTFGDQGHAELGALARARSHALWGTERENRMSKAIRTDTYPEPPREKADHIAKSTPILDACAKVVRGLRGTLGGTGDIPVVVPLKTFAIWLTTRFDDSVLRCGEKNDEGSLRTGRGLSTEDVDAGG
ncbi:hypothetical protein L226DRAFT_575617 [Lentinus tigrinus ALCF2SS1-7]|uniref:uncharacterized protein n=1 Tax=Lentinus tigrinus ALCF2SS1-7 TaxID=1328758 RepID=UPI001165CC81|nr:hypothetical protein L226DRAFT_575617 [Lentinus tigrinus ALCF2SS1-7]